MFGGTKHVNSDLVKISNYQILQIKLLSLFYGLLFLLKRALKHLIGYKYDSSSIDRPPICLIDSSLGTHSYVKLKGVKLHYVDVGDKNAQLVLLLHGFPDCWLTWRHQIPELAKHYRVVAVDLKGFGDSDKPDSIQPYNVVTVVREIRDLISMLGYKKCILIGHDLGAVVGWFIIHFCEDMVVKFISVSAAHPNYYWESMFNYHIFNSRWIQFCQLPYLAEWMALDDNLKLLDEVFSHLKKGSSGKTMLAAYKYAFSRAEDWTGAINYFRNWPFYRLNVTRNYSVNTLFIVGNKDGNPAIEGVIKSSELTDKFSVKLVKNAGHYPHQEKPKEVNQLISNFLIGLPATSPMKDVGNPPGIVNRMFDAVTSTVKYGSEVINVVHKTTNGLTARASIPFGQYS